MESSRRGLLNDMAEPRPIFKNNQNTHYSVLEIDLSSATSVESSHRDLLNDGAEHLPILKNNQARKPQFGFLLQNRFSIPQNGGFVFTV